MGLGYTEIWNENLVFEMWFIDCSSSRESPIQTSWGKGIIILNCLEGIYFPFNAQQISYESHYLGG